MKEGGGNGRGEDPGENAHSNEVISALADEGNLGEGEEDDFDDLYGDLDLQSLKSNMEERERKIEPPQQFSAPPPAGNVTQASGATVGGGSTAYERGVGNQGMRGSGLPAQRGRNMNKNETGGARTAVGGGTVTDAGAVRVGCNGGEGQRVVFVQELNYWTTDAEVETEVCKYGMVKEVKFFEEKESGKSKGTCKVKFYDSGAAAACQAGMNGHVFDGRPCVVSFSPPQDCWGEVVVSKPAGQMRNDSGSSLGRGQGGSDSNNGEGMGNRGYGMRSGAPPPPPPQMMMHSMARGLNPALGRHMGDYGLGGCMHVPHPPLPVSGMMQPHTPVWRMSHSQPFRPPPPPVWGMRMPGYVNVNPTFIGRGMSMPNIGMWQDRTSTPERGREAKEEELQHHGNGQGTGSQLRVTRQGNDRHRSVSVSLHSRSRDREGSDAERERDGEEDRKRKRDDERDKYMGASDPDPDDDDDDGLERKRTFFNISLP